MKKLLLLACLVVLFGCNKIADTDEYNKNYSSETILKIADQKITRTDILLLEYQKNGKSLTIKDLPDRETYIEYDTTYKYFAVKYRLLSKISDDVTYFQFKLADNFANTNNIVFWQGVNNGLGRIDCLITKY